jgi:hypothetical protein
MLELIKIPKNDDMLKRDMELHYSKPKGFVGRSICYEIRFLGVRYGSIVAGSTPMHLPGRKEYFRQKNMPIILDNIVNNIFFRVQRVNGRYPIRNFTTHVMSTFRKTAAIDWVAKYMDEVVAFETLVELPRTGELYVKDGWRCTGVTKGFTCKRISGLSSDSWSGRRVWDRTNLRPKRVFTRFVDNYESINISFGGDRTLHGIMTSWGLFC